jgi:hypothetical protein
MPSDDLVLNIRQIASYPPTADALQGDQLVLQRGLGGPYLSISAQALIATALASGGGPLDVSTGYAPADAVQAQIFTDNLVVALGATHNWNCYFSSTLNAFAYTTNGPAAAFGFNGNAGFVWDAGAFGAAGSVAALSQLMQLSPTGQLLLFSGSITLPRDPMAPNEAATAGWVSANTVASFNGRIGAVALGTWDILYAGGAPIWSPEFGGAPTAPTPEPAACGNQIATAAFVKTAIGEFFNTADFVDSFNGRTGAVVLEAADVTALTLPYAPIDSPNFTGYATSLTPPAGSATGQIATTAFVMNAVGDSVTGVATFNTRSGNVVLLAADLTAAGGALLASPAFTGSPTALTPPPGDNSLRLATTAFVAAAGVGNYAPLNSPAFTGVPTGPTAAQGTNTDQLATTGFVLNQITAIDSGVVSFNGRSGVVSLLANDISAAGGATLNSPVFTGNPTAPTAAPGNNSGTLANTAFVMAAIAALPAVPLPSTANPLINGAVTPGTSALFARGDHVHPTDTTRAAAAALANYLPLAGGTLTGPLAGVTGTFSSGFTVSNLQVNNGLVQINVGNAVNPVLFLNDGSTNRVSFYFDVATGASTWTDNYSGANIAMGPSNSMMLTAGLVSTAGNFQTGGQINIAGFVLTNSGGYLYSTSGFMAPVLRWSGSAGGLLNPSGIAVVGDIANMAIVATGSSPSGLAFECTNAANTVAYFLWVDSGSDIRIKENIAPTQVDALAAVLAIPVREFDFNPRASDALRGPMATPRVSSYHVPLGLVAQEVMGLIPDMDVVVAQPEGRDPALPADLHAIVLPNAVPYLIRAIQQLELRVRELEGATLQ